jgi:hypothetical protein
MVLKDTVLLIGRLPAVLESISKIGFWFKIAAGPSFKLQVRLRRIEDLKRGTNKDIEPKDIFEIGSNPCSAQTGLY